VYCSDLDRLQTSYKLRQEFSEERGLNMPDFLVKPPEFFDMKREADSTN